MAAQKSSLSENVQQDLGKRTILLVEDEDFVRNITREVLELSGHCVLEANDANSGIQLFEEMYDQIDLVLTDVVMPGMNGRDLANRLLSMRPDLRVVFMSGYTDNAIVREGFSDPRLNYLQKPFTLDALNEKIHEVLNCASPVLANESMGRQPAIAQLRQA